MLDMAIAWQLTNRLLIDSGLKASREMPSLRSAGLVYGLQAGAGRRSSEAEVL
jgi:hypothetical protein